MSATRAVVPSRSELEAMIGMLRHRGPDGTGFFTGDGVGLAHSRLSIIDIATGDQPIANEDRSIWTVFNGEIFNFIELRQQLRHAGHVFRTQSDTETIVHAYEEFGDEFVQRLNGQFAIALYDEKRRRLVLARDRVGIRPLFVQRDGDRWLFASEIKALLRVSRVPAVLDLDGLAQVFSFWSTVGERTVFRGVRSLPPGHMLTIEDGVERLTRYWEWQYAEPESGRSFDESAAELRSLLADAVRLQLRADVPVGAYLSGGLDSSLIGALIQRDAGVPLRTFSVTFDDAEYDESSFQLSMARHLGTEHSTVHCKARDIGEVFPRLVCHLETPVLRTGPAPLMMLSQFVRESGLKVVLTGEGADEIFAGYDLFKEAQVRRFWARQPGSRGRPALLARLYPYLRNSPVATAAQAQSFFGRGLGDTALEFYGHQQRWATTKRTWQMFSADTRAALAHFDPTRELRALAPPEFARWPGLQRDQWTEVHTLLHGYLLSSQGDRAAMASSVEGRVPFLDHRVIEFANRLPARFKLRGLKEKRILRRAAQGLLPDSILTRVKQPYRAPDSLSFFVNGNPLEFVADLLSSSRVRDAGYFEPLAVSKLVDKCRAGKALGFADNMAFVGVLSTMILDDVFVRAKAAERRVAN